MDGDQNFPRNNPWLEATPGALLTGASPGQCISLRPTSSWARAESHRHSCVAGSTQSFQPLSLEEDPLLLLTLQWEGVSPVNQLLSADPNQSCEKEKQGLYFPSVSNWHETRFSKVTVRNTKTRTSWLLGLCSPGASRSRYQTDRHMSRKQLPKKSSTANIIF